jgi:hypothetical protein
VSADFQNVGKLKIRQLYNVEHIVYIINRDYSIFPSFRQPIEEPIFIVHHTVWRITAYESGKAAVT